MKPIFEEERLFLESKTGMPIPKYCWKHRGRIYLNHDSNDYILQISTKLGGDINIDATYNYVYDSEKPHKSHKRRRIYHDVVYGRTYNPHWLEEFENYQDKLFPKIKKSIDKTVEYILDNIDKRFIVSISGGKDSLVMKHIVDEAIARIKKLYGIKVTYDLISFNPSNETHDTYKYLKEYFGLDSSTIISPDIGFHKWIVEEKNCFIPQVTANTRMCCEKFKEGQLDKVMDRDEETVTFLGMRSAESPNRKEYSWDLNEAMIEAGKDLNVPMNWQRFLPIVEWEELDIWFYILANDLKINPMYKKGFDRVGCLICYYCKDYTLALIQHFYPKSYARWINILCKHYEIWNVKKRLKWDEYEFAFEGKWRTGLSKEYEIINGEPTPEKLEYLSFLKGNLSEEMCLKYFKQNCKCGKRLNPTELAMFFKLMGRYEDKEDNRTYLCKKCLCKALNIKPNDYKNMSINFMKEDCELF